MDQQIRKDSPTDEDREHNCEIDNQCFTAAHNQIQRWWLIRDFTLIKVSHPLVYNGPGVV